jgi:hypothetical protein
MIERSKKSQNLITYCTENGRVCPFPWVELYELLPNTKRNNKGGWDPSLPLILAAWFTTSNLMKILRLREHIEWADQHNAIDAVDEFLRALPEDKWHHLKDYL